MVDERLDFRALSIEEWVNTLLAALLHLYLVVSLKIVSLLHIGTTLYQLLGSSGDGCCGSPEIAFLVLCCVGLWCGIDEARFLFLSFFFLDRSKGSCDGLCDRILVIF